MYLTQSEMSQNGSLRNRVAQCAAGEGKGTEADSWAQFNARVWAASPGWGEAWEYAENVHSGDAEYDPGADEAVITDGMILSEVQLLLNPPVEVTPA